MAKMVKCKANLEGKNLLSVEYFNIHSEIKQTNYKLKHYPCNTVGIPSTLKRLLLSICIFFLKIILMQQFARKNMHITCLLLLYLSKPHFQEEINASSYAIGLTLTQEQIKLD